MEAWTRRKFFFSTLAGAVVAGTQRLLGATSPSPRAAITPRALAPQGTTPIIVSSANGFEHLDGGMTVQRSRGDTLDAALAIVTKVEADHNDDSVGYGGLPNENAVVKLDASVMQGPTGRAGAIASIQ